MPTHCINIARYQARLGSVSTRRFVFAKPSLAGRHYQAELGNEKTTHPKYTQDNYPFLQKVFSYLKRINPNFSESWVLAVHLSRYEFAQPVCTPNFYSQLPPMQTPITGFFMADTSYSYREDRSITENVKLGKELARLISDTLA